MLQDIGQGLFRNEYMPVPPQKEDIVFSFDGGKTLLREGEEGIEVPLVGSLLCGRDGLSSVPLVPGQSVLRSLRP